VSAVSIVISTVVTAVATTALAIITFAYARSTAHIAKISVDAAQAAKEAAESALLQNALMVQPRLLATAPLVMDYVPSTVLLNETSAQYRVPVRVATRLTNAGPGPAINLSITLSMFDIPFTALVVTDGSSVPPAASVEVQFGAVGNARHRAAIAAGSSSARSEGLGLIRVTCQDTIGYIIVTTWKIVARSDSTLILAERDVEYQPPISHLDLPHMPLVDSRLLRQPSKRRQ
jgi:hypothetical protein